ncbi:MAG: response regulator [Bacteroidales bacterium]|jgi:signal transduction histidine kinase/DNA-binding response OmpR family regulator/HAMP domain-containing protein|nr:response regulator [Bacteroidales bacterium]
MKLKDLKIGTQLKMGFGIIFLLIFMLSAISWHQTNKIANQVSVMYNHPLKVRRALGELKSEILYMRVGMKNVSMAEDDEELVSLLQVIEKHKANAFAQFKVMSTLYLGPPEDIEVIHNDFLVWNSIRDETIRLRREGKIQESTARSRTGGIGQVQAELLLSHLLTIDDFALNKGDQLYLNSVTHNKTLNYQLAFLILGIMGLVSLLVYFLIRNIRLPLIALSKATQYFNEGKLDARSTYQSRNEFGQFSSHFNELADTVEIELNLNTQSAKLSEIMLGEEDANRFCHALLTSLLEQTGAQVGAIYLLNEEASDFECFESLGMNSKACKSFSAVNFEGEFGTALASQKIQHITDIPDDTHFVFSTVSGQFTPREMITVPIVSGNETVAVVSLATIKNFNKNTLRLLETILSTLSARMEGILAFRKIVSFSQKLEHQNQELESQKSELSTQTSELTEQNIELEIQKNQLDEVNQMKTSFLSNMSHELRTPLNSVIALSGVLNRRLAGKVAEEEYGYIDVIERNGKQLLFLINDILDLSRIEAGHEDIEINKFDVNELISEVVEMIEPQAILKSIGLHYSSQHKHENIESDYNKCRHILQNLVANAVKFTEEGSVEITTELKDDMLHIVVSDSGIGIENEDLPFIFDEFRQADNSNSRKHGGTGLGLAIAKKYTGLLGGSISVESRWGKGSIFTITLPLHFSEMHPNSEVQALDYRKTAPQIVPHHGLMTTKDKTILLVEDTASVIIQMKDMLTSEGYTIMVARNGSEALEQIALKIPDAMILDLMMPEVDGFEVLKRVRAEEKTSRLPVIILTAKYVSKEELATLRHNNISQLIQKGDINKDQLLSEVAQMLFPETKVQKTPEKRGIRKPIVGLPVVLVVEDNSDNMLTIKALLEGRCTVIEAGDGLLGLEMAHQHQPHLILMDIALPGMNGIDALTALRKDSALHHTPVVAVSASAMKGDKEDFIAYGFDGYISKPIDNKKFEKTLKEWIG